MSFLVLSTNIRCEVAWLDAFACDTQCLLVVGMLGWFLIRPRGLPLTLSGSEQQISSWYFGGGVVWTSEGSPTDNDQTLLQIS